MSEVQAADSVIRFGGPGEEGHDAANDRVEYGKQSALGGADTSTPVTPQDTIKRGDSPDEDRDLRSEDGKSY